MDSFFNVCDATNDSFIGNIDFKIESIVILLFLKRFIRTAIED